MTLSVEDQLSSIEKQYKTAYKMLSSIRTAASISTVKYYRNPDYISETIKAALTFQRSIDLLFEDIKKLSDEKTKYYIERLSNNVSKIRLMLTTSKISKTICDSIDLGEYADAFDNFQIIRSWMYQILEDVRLIYALRIYPIEEKIALKSTLTDYGFMEVTSCLEEAEEHLAEKHFKDCITRCRESLEKTSSSILAAEKKKPSGYFATDIGTLSGLGIIDKEVKKLTEATYSYLSEIGAHGRGGKLTLGDAHFAMKETYMRIDILLKKYAAYLSRKK